MGHDLDRLAHGFLGLLVADAAGVPLLALLGAEAGHEALEWHQRHEVGREVGVGLREVREALRLPAGLVLVHLGLVAAVDACQWVERRLDSGVRLLYRVLDCPHLRVVAALKLGDVLACAAALALGLLVVVLARDLAGHVLRGQPLGLRRDGRHEAV